MARPSSNPRLARDLLLALGAAAAALLLQWGLLLATGRSLPFLLIEPAVIFTAATLGRWPAFLVLVIGAVNAMVALSTPVGWAASEYGDRWAVAAYAAIGALLIVFGGRMRLRSGRAERAEQRLSLAQDETGVGLFELDYRDDTAYASPALCQILGQPVMRDSMPLQQWLDALGAGHVSESLRNMKAKVAAGELRYERELQVALPDGQQRWLLSRIRLDLDARGRLAAARGATLDITARKKLLTELEAAQSQLRQQLDDLGRLHGLGNRLLATPALDKALQATLDAVCSFHGTAFGFLRLREPGGGSRVVAHCGFAGEALRQLVAADAPLEADPVCGAAARSRERVVIDDLVADDVPAAQRLLALASGVRFLHGTPLVAGGDGPVLGVLAVFAPAAVALDERLLRLTDLCAGQAAALIEREEALALARETQQRFEVALQSSPVAFTILAPVRDETGRTTDFAWSYVNPAAAALIGRPVQALVGRRVLDVLAHAWNESGLFERYVRVAEHGATDEFETMTQRTAGERWLHVIASPLNGSVVLWFADITQRREEQLALRDADRRKDEFLATLAHELRNPLAPIRHAAEIIGEPAASEPQRQWSLAVIDRQLRHMTLLLDDLLDVSRITRGALRLRRERCPLRPILEAAVETLRPLFGQRRHRLALDLPDAPVWLDVDPLRIEQVVGNLLANAAKYTPPGGEVCLTARKRDGEVVVAVTDNGVGLRPEDCERVFQMFVQMPSTDARSQGGLGIGLALARNLVELHGGRLVAESAGPGRGCTFTVHLPVASADAAAGTAGETRLPPAGLPAASTSRRILVADDNRDAADSLAMLLRLEGFEVRTAYDGIAALACHGDFRPRVALLDMGMPGHSGAEVAALVRRRQGREPITLVAITGYGQQRDREQALVAGFDHHLTKPIRRDQLLALLGAVFAAPAGDPGSGAATG